MFNPSNAKHGQLSINGVNLNTPATKLMNLQVLWSRTLRGESVTIPYVAGRTSRRRRIDERSFDLDMIVIGSVTMAGVGASDQWQQLDTTMLYLYDNIVTPTSIDTGYTSVLTLRTGATKTASVFVDNWEVFPDPTGAPRNNVTFTLTVPSGGWS